MLEETAFSGQPDANTLQAVQPKILVIGLGNPILGDDGVGWHVCQCIQAHIATDHAHQLPTNRQAFEPLFERQAQIAFECLSLGGLALMERMIDYTHAVIIDAVATQTHPIGEVLAFPLDQLPTTGAGHLASAHDTSLQNALQMGRLLGAKLPAEIFIIGIEAQVVFDFCENLTDEVAAAVPKACRLAVETINHWLHPLE